MMVGAATMAGTARATETATGSVTNPAATVIAIGNGNLGTETAIGTGTLVGVGAVISTNMLLGGLITTMTVVTEVVMKNMAWVSLVGFEEAVLPATTWMEVTEEVVARIATA